MTDEEILRAIRELQGNDPKVDEEKILAAVMAELQEQERFDPNAPPLSRLLRARLYLRGKGVGTIPVVLGLLAGVLIVTALATPADRAVASWITGLFETGQPGGRPSLITPLPTPGSAERPAEMSAVVVGTAVLMPGEVRTELTVINAPEGESCIALDIPMRNFHLADCAPGPRKLPIIGAATSGGPAGLSGVLVLGEAPAEARRVVIAPANGSGAMPTVPATLFDPPAEVRARAGLGDESTYFVAHLTQPIAPRLVAIARTRSGQPVGRSEPLRTGRITPAQSGDDFVPADPP